MASNGTVLFDAIVPPDDSRSFLNFEGIQEKVTLNINGDAVGALSLMNYLYDPNTQKMRGVEVARRASGKLDMTRVITWPGPTNETPADHFQHICGYKFISPNHGHSISLATLADQAANFTMEDALTNWAKIASVFGVGSPDDSDKAGSSQKRPSITNDWCHYRDHTHDAKSKQKRGKKECAKIRGCSWDLSMKGGGACQASGWHWEPIGGQIFNETLNQCQECAKGFFSRKPDIDCIEQTKPGKLTYKQVSVYSYGLRSYGPSQILTV